MTKIVLVIGSAPDAMRARDIDQRLLSGIVVINNAWRVRDDWTHLVHAGDFPAKSIPTPGPGQQVHSSDSYVPANNRFGGVVYAGGTMAFTAGYWALDALRPDVMAFCGCDMIYSQTSGKTHFYGNGSADPLRPDPTLQHLEAKANRLLIMAAQEGCLCVNLSEKEESRLTFPRLTIADLANLDRRDLEEDLSATQDLFDPEAISAAQAREKEANCFVAQGDYWNHDTAINAAALSEIDRHWLAAAPILTKR
ncbi:MAG: hypothetical protein AAF414_15355 [Pseudomonadota bacterium]